MYSIVAIVNNTVVHISKVGEWILNGLITRK